ncbi:MAG: SDR family NAD(P)-dependent oxidoreductase [Deltaproteobacteria bacterium]|nr:SDR family NAD(P)-dependent oxidoreductase [Deltaproteobacteria bacterium]
MKHICITGASSGLGAALALAYAQAGSLLTLWARDETRLAATAEACKGKGAATAVVAADLRDHRAARETLAGLDDANPVDVVFLAAGVITGIPPGGNRESAEDAFRTMDVNALGSLNLAACLFERMCARGSGHLIFVSSIAGLYPLPNSPSYSASKIAVSYYARGLAAIGRRFGVRVSCVYPGYLETPMGRRLKALKPFALPPDKAADLIRSRLEKGKDRVVFPLAAALGVYFLHVLPKPLADRLALKAGYRVVPDRESNTYA